MNEKMNDALNEISDRHIDEAATYKKRRNPWWFAAVAAVLAVVLLVGVLWNPRANLPTIQSTKPNTFPSIAPPKDPGSLQLSNLVASPSYPIMPQRPNRQDYTHGSDYSNDYLLWQKEINLFYNQPDGYADSLTNFFFSSIQEFLSGSENGAYSPVNVYLAMAMLAQTADGNSRQEILDLFGLDSIEALQEQASHVWNAHYRDDGESICLLANSLWLDDSHSFHQNTVDALANHFYATSFHGDLGTASMNEQLRTWLDAQTGGLLQDQVGNVKLDPEAVLALASTVYYTANWKNPFNKKKTADAVFYCDDKNLITPFMNATFTGTYYRANHFSAVELPLSDGNSMWLILPGKWFDVADILKSDDYLQLILAPQKWKNQKEMIIHLSLPKFDVSSQMNLVAGMKNLGVTDIFDAAISDFTPITDTPNLFVNKIDHSARVRIDEKGVTGAAYTILDFLAGGNPPEDEVDFILDRPFLFIVTSQDNLPLFAGTVTEP